MKIIAFTALCTVLLFGGELRAQDPYDSTRIVEIRIRFDQPDWHELLDSMKMEGNNKRLLAAVSIDGKSFDKVGVRYKGNSSFKNPRSKGHRKLPFNLKADEEIKGQTFPEGYKTLKLSNSFMDPSFLREILSYEMARQYMPASRCNFARLWVNDEYLGLYLNTQPVDWVFLENHFGASGNTFIKCDPEYEVIKNLDPSNCPKGDKASLVYMGEDPACYEGWYELESKSQTGWLELIELIKVLNGKPDEIEQLLNVDATLWMHAFNSVLVNLDSYTGRLSHNYYLYRTPDNLFTPIVWDMNISLGGFRWDGVKAGELTTKELVTYSLFTHYKSRNPKRPLITNLLSNPLYRKIYAGHCRTIVNEQLANGAWLKRARQLQALIDEAVKNDPEKLYTYEDFRNNLKKSVLAGNAEISGLEELLSKRTEYLLGHPLFNGPNPEFSDVTHRKVAEGIAIEAAVSPARKVYLMMRSDATEAFRQVEMKQDAEGRWSCLVPDTDRCDYYLIAEGERLAVCSPERAAFEYYTVE